MLHRCAIDSETLYLVSISIAFTSLWWYGGRGSLGFLLALGINPSFKQETRSSDDLHHTQTDTTHTHTAHRS